MQQGNFVQVNMDYEPGSVELNETCPPIPEQYQFILAGTGRSGSKSMAHFLTRLGIPTAHEKVWHPNRQWSLAGYEEIRTSNRILDTPIRPWGESSWMTVPFFGYIKKKRPDIRIIGIWRNPIDVFNSLVGQPLIPKYPFGEFYDFHFGLTDEYKNLEPPYDLRNKDTVKILARQALLRINTMYGDIRREAEYNFQLESFRSQAIYNIDHDLEIDPVTHEWQMPHYGEAHFDHWRRNLYTPFISALGPCAYFCKFKTLKAERRPRAFGGHQVVDYPQRAVDIIRTPWSQSYNHKNRWTAQTIDDIRAVMPKKMKTHMEYFQGLCEFWEALTLPPYEPIIDEGEDKN